MARDGYSADSQFPRGFGIAVLSSPLTGPNKQGQQDWSVPGTKVKVASIQVHRTTTGAATVNVTNHDGTILYAAIQVPASGTRGSCFAMTRGFTAPDGLRISGVGSTYAIVTTYED